MTEFHAGDCSGSDGENGTELNPILGLSGSVLAKVFLGVLNAIGAAGAIVAVVFSRGC